MLKTLAVAWILTLDWMNVLTISCFHTNIHNYTGSFFHVSFWQSCDQEKFKTYYSVSLHQGDLQDYQPQVNKHG